MKYPQILFVLIIIIVFSSCDGSGKTETPEPLEINPVYNENKLNKEQDTLLINTNNKKPKVTLDPDDFLIDLIDTNLDLDSHDEQILIVKNNSISDSLVRILVADFDNIINSYSVSWEGVTGSDNISSLSITLNDITGDHNLEIICSGTDLDGKETLNIYRRTPSEGGIVLHFTEILNLTVDGNIEIKEVQRLQTYQTGTSDGISFPIVITTTDQESENILDLIEETWFWRNQESEYKLISRVKIPGAEIEDNKLKELYRNNRNYFRTFLDGPWMLSRNENSLSYQNPIVYFDTKKEQVVFSNDDFLEIYIWESSSKTLSNTLQLTCKNDLVPFLDVTIFVKVLDLNTISLRFRDNSIRNSRNAENQVWTGNYFKLNPEIQKNLIDEFRSVSSDSTIPVLSGYYKSDTGDEFSFNSPNFTLKTENQFLKGGFYLFDNGHKIAEFKMLDNNNLVENILTYKYDYFEEINEIEIIRTIILIPGELTIKGFIPSGEQFTRFIQIEQIERNEPDNKNQ
ncbi:MAG: pallilysin-related adhesin [Spirochaetales bacterium]|nr:pallilysin-related adhesin [Spirochaetales bacterium]